MAETPAVLEFDRTLSDLIDRLHALDSLSERLNSTEQRSTEALAGTAEAASHLAKVIVAVRNLAAEVNRWQETASGRIDGIAKEAVDAAREMAADAREEAGTSTARLEEWLNRQAELADQRAAEAASRSNELFDALLVGFSASLHDGLATLLDTAGRGESVAVRTSERVDGVSLDVRAVSLALQQLQLETKALEQEAADSAASTRKALAMMGRTATWNLMLAAASPILAAVVVALLLR